MLYDFLLQNREEILAITEKKTVALAGSRPSSAELRRGLPLFFNQLLGILQMQRPAVTADTENQVAATRGAEDSDEPAMARAAGKPEEAALAKSAGNHGAELLRLGYTLSHVVHAYGAMCQAITELTTKKNSLITTTEFHDLNQCLDVAIAGAVTEFQDLRNKQVSNRETEHLGSLAHEMRNAITSISISFQLIRKGTVGPTGNTGDVIVNNLKRIEGLIDRSLTEVRLRVDPEIHVDSFPLTQLVDQILVSASIEAQARNQNIKLLIDPTLTIEADQQAFYSALSNLIQNAIKYSPVGGLIEIRGKTQGSEVVIEVEDQCGGLLGNEATDLFKPFVQRNENRTGLGLGLSIAKKAIEELNHGKIEVRTVDKTGCIFTIRLPRHQEKKTLKPAA